MSRQSVIGQIEWPEKSLLKSRFEWWRNVQMVKILCKIGTITEWNDGQKGKDLYTHMPYHYDIDSVTVKFLPHWEYYNVGGITLMIPFKEAQVLEAVSAVKTLKHLGSQLP